MKFLKGLMAVVATVAFAASAQAATWDVVGGNFFMGGVGGAALLPGDPGQLVEGSYQGATGASADDPIVADFVFFGNPVDTYTMGPMGPNPAPSINTGAGTADMSSFTAFWNGTEFNQGSAAAVYAAGAGVGGSDRLTWSSLIVGGPFNGFTGNWTLDVTVPEPMSMVLVGSSLIGLVGLRRKLMA